MGMGMAKFRPAQTRHPKTVNKFSMKQRFNAEYSRLLGEVSMFILFSLFKKDESCKNAGRILIVNTCLIGEFSMSIPAIVDFIERNP